MITVRIGVMRVAALLILIALVAAGCGSSENAQDAATTGASESNTEPEISEPASTQDEQPADAQAESAEAPENEDTSSSGAVDDGGVSWAVDHKYGQSVFTETPARVITLGFSEQDPVLALGVVPIAVREWFGGFEYATWSWAQDELGAGTPQVLDMPFGELNYELIASLAPDLIVATHAGINEEEYDLLAAIAPTIAESADVPPFGMSWQEQTHLIGDALGLSNEAKQAVTIVEAATLDTARTYDDFSGASFAWANPTGEGTYWVVGDSTPPMQFLQELGLQYPDDLRAVVGDADSFELSGEQLALLDVDVLIVQAAPEVRADIESDPLWSDLGVMTEERIVWLELDDPVYGALSFSTILSIDYLLEEFAPIVDGIVSGAGNELGPEAQAAMDAFALVYDSAADWETKAPFLENSVLLESSNQSYAAAGEGVGGIGLQPTSVEIDGDAATITYDVMFGEAAAYQDLTRTITLVDGTWTVAQSDYCDFLASARAMCDVPEEEAEIAAASPLEAGAANGATLIANFSSFSNAFSAAIEGDGPVTAFLPSDAALGASQELQPELSAALRQDFELLDQVLQYHVVDTAALLGADIASLSELETLLGESIAVSVEGDSLVLNGGQATVSIADIEASNGVVHVIDGLLVPPSRASEFDS